MVYVSESNTELAFSMKGASELRKKITESERRRKGMKQGIQVATPGREAKKRDEADTIAQDGETLAKLLFHMIP